MDDPLDPPMFTEDGQTFRDWVDFVDRVARPLVEASSLEAMATAMRLYWQASPYFICVALLMAYNRAYPQPTQFDPDDKSTWPEKDVRVLARRGFDGSVALAALRYQPPGTAAPDAPHWWWEGNDSGWEPAELGDQWIPLPALPGEER